MNQALELFENYKKRYGKLKKFNLTSSSAIVPENSLLIDASGFNEAALCIIDGNFTRIKQNPEALKLIQNMIINENIYLDSQLIFYDDITLKNYEEFKNLIKLIRIENQTKGYIHDFVNSPDFKNDEKVAKKLEHLYRVEDPLFTSVKKDQEQEAYRNFYSIIIEHFYPELDIRQKLIIESKIDNIEYINNNFDKLSFLADLLNYELSHDNQGYMINSSTHLQRHLYYLELASQLELFFTPHNKRAGFFISLFKDNTINHINALNYNLDFALKNNQNEKIITDIKNAINTQRMNSNYEIPPVADYVINFSKQKNCTIFDSIQEIKEQPLTKKYREFCQKYNQAIRLGNQGVAELQELTEEIKIISSKWQEDVNLGAKYEAKQINLWRLISKVNKFHNPQMDCSEIVESLDLKRELKVKDPIIFGKKPYLLFLNSLFSRKK